MFPCLAQAEAQERGPASATTSRVSEPAANDEPRLDRSTGRSKNPYDTDGYWYRLELAFGYFSLLADPDVAEGFGGGLYFAMGLHPRVGVELSFLIGQNAFEGDLGTINNSEFLAGNLTLGPVIRLTPLSWPASITADLGIGFYGIKDLLRQKAVFTLGISGGFTLAYHAFRWLALGVKVRYNLFNLATISGEDLIDVKSLGTVGVLDRFDLPAYVAFFC